MGWMFSMPGESLDGELPSLTPEERRLAERLEGHVETLAGSYPRRHHLHPERYRQAATYGVKTFERMGYEVEREPVETDGETYPNIVAERPGETRPDEIVVIGAHYDAVRGSPGADDNASGVAGVLELARAWQKTESPARTVRFVLFANEERPWFRTDAMGSWHHARRARSRDEAIVVMISLEMIGYYRTDPGSQSYPAGLEWIYPERGDFIAFVGNLRSRGAVRASLEAFRMQDRHPSEGIAAPAWIPGIGLSDHWAFWEEGETALMVTDTALYRNPHYHQRSDRPDTLDYERMARVTTGLRRVLERWGRGIETP